MVEEDHSLFKITNHQNIIYSLINLFKVSYPTFIQHFGSQAFISSSLTWACIIILVNVWLLCNFRLNKKKRYKPGIYWLMHPYLAAYSTVFLTYKLYLGRLRSFYSSLPFYPFHTCSAQKQKETDMFSGICPSLTQCLPHTQLTLCCENREREKERGKVEQAVCAVTEVQVCVSERTEGKSNVNRLKLVVTKQHRVEEETTSKE